MNNKQNVYVTDAVENNLISRDDAIKMYPNEIADYFDKWEYKPKAVIPGASTPAVKGNPDSSEIDKL